MAVLGMKVLVGSLLGLPWMVVGNPDRSAPVVMSRACRYQCGWSRSGPSLTLDVK